MRTCSMISLKMCIRDRDYTVPFDVNASFAEAFETYLENAKN